MMQILGAGASSMGEKRGGAWTGHRAEDLVDPFGKDLPGRETDLERDSHRETMRKIRI